ncbi:MAG TPA: hypothetical protein VKK81_10865 [Candidatus Binatia bacterium]|nr:hypothetical protein [Candidatus Binatia bacterium]
MIIILLTLDLSPFSGVEQVSAGGTADLDQWFATPYDGSPERRTEMIIPYHGITLRIDPIGAALWKTRRHAKFL